MDKEKYLKVLKELERIDNNAHLIEQFLNGLRATGDKEGIIAQVSCKAYDIRNTYTKFIRSEITK